MAQLLNTTVTGTLNVTGNTTLGGTTTFNNAITVNNDVSVKDELKILDTNDNVVGSFRSVTAGTTSVVGATLLEVGAYKASNVAGNSIGRIRLLNGTNQANIKLLLFTRENSPSDTNTQTKYLLHIGDAGGVYAGGEIGGNEFNLYKFSTNDNSDTKIMLGTLKIASVGTASTTGKVQLILGNNRNSTTANNAYGEIILYSSGISYVSVVTSINSLGANASTYQQQRLQISNGIISRELYLTQNALTQGEGGKSYFQIKLNPSGSTSTQGKAEMILGNNLSSSTDKNASGIIQMYGAGDGSYAKTLTVEPELVYDVDINMTPTIATDDGSFVLENLLATDNLFTRGKLILGDGSNGVACLKQTVKGTSSVEGKVVLCLGNDAPSNITGNASGEIRLYCSNSSYAAISVNNTAYVTISTKLNVNAINATDGNGLLTYHPTDWSWVSSTQWGVGATNCQGVIRSNDTDLIHARNGTNYTILDTYNCMMYGSGAVMATAINNTTSSFATILKNYASTTFANDTGTNRNRLVCYYSNAYGNGALLMGYWLAGYKYANMYGGFYVCHYTNARYVGVSNGSFTQYDITKTTSSSRKIKTNIINMTDEEGKKLLNINPVSFDYKNPNYGEKNQYGFIAEDLQAVIPYVVKCQAKNKEELEKNPALLQIDYVKFIPYLVKMIQIQQKEIDELKSKI